MNKKDLDKYNRIYQDKERIKRQLHQLIGFWGITGKIYIKNLFNEERVFLTDEANYKINQIIKEDLEKQLKEKEGMLNAHSIC